MDQQGSCRKGFSLFRRPIILFRAKSRGAGGVVPVFEPFEENLPLESGYYTFVLDRLGRFRVRRGNLSSHATMVDSEDVGAAGRFLINRAGNVAEVYCISRDYRINVKDAYRPTVDFVIESFSNHHALELSPYAIFQFAGSLTDSFRISVDRSPIADLNIGHYRPPLSAE